MRGRQQRLTARDSLPRDANRTEDTQATQDQAQLKSLHNGLVVDDQNVMQSCRIHDGPQSRRASMNNILRIQTRDLQSNHPANQVRREEVLRHSDEQRAAQNLDEQDDRGADGHVFELQDGLGGDTALLETEADAEAVEEGEADPLGLGGVDGEEIAEAGADAHGDAASYEEGGVLAGFCDGGAGEDDGDDLGEDEGEGVDACCYWACAFDGLELGVFC